MDVVAGTTLLIEGGLWLAALVVYVRATRASKRAGIYVFWPVIAFVMLAWIGNVLFLAWAYWMDRVRKPEAAY